LFRIISYHFSANAGGDAGARVALTAAWLQHPRLQFVFDVYPPGHFWLIGPSALLVHDVVAAGRLLSLVLGLGSLVFVWALARLLYGTGAGLLSLAVFSFYSLHVGYSTTSSSEVSYLFFFVAGAYFLFSYLQNGHDKLWRLALSGVCLSVSQSIRYEAWILFGGLFVILAVLLQGASDRRQWGAWVRSLMVFGVTGGAWPVFMMAYSWRMWGDPMHLVTLNRVRVHTFIVANSISLSHQLTLVPLVLLITLSPFAVAGVMYGLANSFSSRFAAAFGSFTLFFGAIQIYEICTGGLLALARYTLTLGLMLAIVSGYGLQRISEKFFPEKTAWARAAVVCLMLVNALVLLAASELPNRFDDKFASVSPILRYQRRIASVGDYLRRVMAPDDSVVIDNYNVESNLIAEAAGLPVLPGDRAYLAANRNSVSVLQYINRVHPRYLVYSDLGTLRRTVDLPPGCSGTENIDGVEFRCTFAGGIYRVYQLGYH
jgi:hypothetical protein